MTDYPILHAPPRLYFVDDTVKEAFLSQKKNPAFDDMERRPWKELEPMIKAYSDKPGAAPRLRNENGQRILGFELDIDLIRDLMKTIKGQKAFNVHLFFGMRPVAGNDVVTIVIVRLDIGRNVIRDVALEYSHPCPPCPEWMTEPAEGSK